MRTEYEPMMSQALSPIAVEGALLELGFERPTLFCGHGLDLFGKQVSDATRINVACDPTLQRYEWYVAYAGRKVGGLGE